MKSRNATCSCGQLRLVALGEPLRVSVCHCLACQARTGSTYGAQASFPRDRVSTEGTSTQYRRVGDEGSSAYFHFCPACGSTVWYRIDDETVTVVPVGAFQDPAFPAPTVSVYEERMHTWVAVPADARHID